jgi:hypothetical protein
MGDSYISGEGVFDYREGTDTQNDHCHLSELSYPFILGKQAFNSYNSVACSGAVTGDVTGSSLTYRGQVKDKIEEQDRKKAPLLSNFLPGYIYQQEFASIYKPEAIVLSVGGNDIGFADVLKQCVANSGGGTCYDTYEDRVELANVINGAYSKLVHTYTTLREQSGGARIYVVGYPQVVKPGGDCGLNVHLNAEEVIFAAQLVDYLNGVIEKATQTAGVFYVDAAHALDGHRLCESAVNGFTVGGDAGIKIRGYPINFIGSESYHPTKLGHQMLAQTISQKTSKLKADMPRPAPYTSAPRLDATATIFQGVPHADRPIDTVYLDFSPTQDVAEVGDRLKVAVTGLKAALQPGASYQIVLHSTPVTIGTGSVDTAGDINTTASVPSGTLPGYHVVHVYTTNMAGEPVDIQKPIYIFPEMSDDGPGWNQGDSCALFPASGVDVDRDGTDDACDAEIGPARMSPIEAMNERASGTVVLKADTVQVDETQVNMVNAAASHNDGGADSSVATDDMQGGDVLSGATANDGHSSSASGTQQIPIQSAAQELLRVNWLTVAIIASVLTSAVATGYYYWPK